ncbi:MAG: hypothetical protein SLAVMIC_00143 [uncultured marine phage]|uniref:Uncharacterized protein n=1 Tax=uncultured marine phage TaxID=707152 RepID=A0A8D9C8F2_9VIRU|nr:MAG: hypothetical protein SLAVMIC_00143 [uncultured marine phage]
MKKISLYKRLKLYNQYRKIIRDNRDKFASVNINLRVDRVNRLYTVLNMDDDVKTYGTSLTEKYIKEYITSVDSIFAQMGLSELVGILEITKLDETNYLIVFGFSLMDTAKLARRTIVFSSITLLIILSLIIF